MALSEAQHAKMKKGAENDPEMSAYILSWNKSNMNDLFNRMLKIGNNEKKLTPADRVKHAAGLESFYSSDLEEQKEITYGRLFDWHREDAIATFGALLRQEKEGLRPRGATLRLMKRYYPTVRDLQFKKGKITYKDDKFSPTQTVPQHLDELYKEAEELSQKKRSVKSRSFRTRS